MENINKVHCLFEQSGTFKNEFRKLGYEAFDYDIQNNFGETDYVIDLFAEIERAYDNQVSVFDQIRGGAKWRPHNCVLPLHILYWFYQSLLFSFRQLQLQVIKFRGQIRCYA